MKVVYLILLSFIPSLALSQKHSLEGYVYDEANIEVIGGCIEVVGMKGETKHLMSDYNGYFFADSLVAGLYTITVQYPGMKNLILKKVHIPCLKELELTLQESLVNSFHCYWTPPLVDPAKPGTGKTLDAWQIETFAW